MEEPQSDVAEGSAEIESKMPEGNPGAVSFEDLYKYRSKKSKSSQEGRRKQFLEEMRLRRMCNVDKNRGFVIEESNEDNEMDTQEIKTYRHRRVCIKRYANKLMFSEPFSEVPNDLENLWFCKLCPIGCRRLVLATNGHTIAFNKNGDILDWFLSKLPSGNRKQKSKKKTLLDCVYNRELKSYFVLDVLIWNNVCLQECETDFRFFFVGSKLNDDPNLGEIDEENHRRLINVDYFPASNHLIEERMEHQYVTDNKVVSIFGVLYYHKESSYISGPNPLVGWLKPHELPVMFGISIPDAYSNRKLNRKERRNNKNLQIEELSQMDLM